MCYSINLGDSRAILSENGGQGCVDLSTDVYLFYYIYPFSNLF